MDSTDGDVMAKSDMERDMIDRANPSHWAGTFEAARKATRSMTAHFGPPNRPLSSELVVRNDYSSQPKFWIDLWKSWAGENDKALAYMIRDITTRGQSILNKFNLHTWETIVQHPLYEQYGDKLYTTEWERKSGIMEEVSQKAPAHQNVDSKSTRSQSLRGFGANFILPMNFPSSAAGMQKYRMEMEGMSKDQLRTWMYLMEMTLVREGLADGYKRMKDGKLRMSHGDFVSYFRFINGRTFALSKNGTALRGLETKVMEEMMVRGVRPTSMLTAIGSMRHIEFTKDANTYAIAGPTMNTIKPQVFEAETALNLQYLGRTQTYGLEIDEGLPFTTLLSDNIIDPLRHTKYVSQFALMSAVWHKLREDSSYHSDKRNISIMNSGSNQLSAISLRDAFKYCSIFSVNNPHEFSAHGARLLIHLCARANNASNANNPNEMYNLSSKSRRNKYDDTDYGGENGGGDDDDDDDDDADDADDNDDAPNDEFAIKERKEKEFRRMFRNDPDTDYYIKQADKDNTTTELEKTGRKSQVDDLGKGINFYNLCLSQGVLTAVTEQLKAKPDVVRLLVSKMKSQQDEPTNRATRETRKRNAEYESRSRQSSLGMHASRDVFEKDDTGDLVEKFKKKRQQQQQKQQQQQQQQKQQQQQQQSPPHGNGFAINAPVAPRYRAARGVPVVAPASTSGMSLSSMYRSDGTKLASIKTTLFNFITPDDFEEEYIGKPESADSIAAFYSNHVFATDDLNKAYNKVRETLKSLRDQLAQVSVPVSDDLKDSLKTAYAHLSQSVLALWGQSTLSIAEAEKFVVAKVNANLVFSMMQEAAMKGLYINSRLYNSSHAQAQIINDADITKNVIGRMSQIISSNNNTGSFAFNMKAAIALAPPTAGANDELAEYAFKLAVNSGKTGAEENKISFGAASALGYLSAQLNARQGNIVSGVTNDSHADYIRTLVGNKSNHISYENDGQNQNLAAAAAAATLASSLSNIQLRDVLFRYLADISLVIAMSETHIFDRLMHNCSSGKITRPANFLRNLAALCRNFASACAENEFTDSNRIFIRALLAELALSAFGEPSFESIATDILLGELPSWAYMISTAVALRKDPLKNQSFVNLHTQFTDVANKMLKARGGRLMRSGDGGGRSINGGKSASKQKVCDYISDNTHSLQRLLMRTRLTRWLFETLIDHNIIFPMSFIIFRMAVEILSGSTIFYVKSDPTGFLCIRAASIMYAETMHTQELEVQVKFDANLLIHKPDNIQFIPDTYPIRCVRGAGITFNSIDDNAKSFHLNNSVQRNDLHSFVVDYDYLPSEGFLPICGMDKRLYAEQNSRAWWYPTEKIYQEIWGINPPDGGGNVTADSHMLSPQFYNKPEVRHLWLAFRCFQTVYIDSINKDNSVVKRVDGEDAMGRIALHGDMSVFGGVDEFAGDGFAPMGRARREE